MTKRTRRIHSPAFKAKVAVAVAKGEATLAALSKRVDVRPNQIAQWKERPIASATNAFGGEARARNPLST